MNFSYVASTSKAKYGMIKRHSLTVLSLTMSYHVTNWKLYRVKPQCQELKLKLVHIKLMCQEYNRVRQVGKYKQQGNTESFVLLEKYAHITVFNTLNVSCERVIFVPSQKWLKSCGGSHLIVSKSLGAHRSIFLIPSPHACCGTTV